LPDRPVLEEAKEDVIDAALELLERFSPLLLAPRGVGVNPVRRVFDRARGAVEVVGTVLVLVGPSLAVEAMVWACWKFFASAVVETGERRFSDLGGGGGD
jgi:hypothetical protein